MGAYNDIEFAAACPACGVRQRIVAQTHVAGSYDGDDTGRFCLRQYQLGERMRWWPRTDPRWPDWTADADLVRLPDGDVTECCYTGCLACGVALFAIIRFRDAVPIEVVRVGLDKDWPIEYPR